MATPIVMPRLGDFMMEGTVIRWSRSQGDSVAQGEVVAEIETEKLNYDLEATEAGVFHPVVPEGATVPVDGLIGYLLAQGESPPVVESPAPQPAQAAPAPRAAPSARPSAPRPPGQGVPSTPGARRLAAKLDVDIADVTPTGPRGRVIEADVRSQAERQRAARAPARPPGLPEPARIVPMGGIRKAIADHMKGSLTASAQLSYFLEVDVTEAQRLRREVSAKGDTSVAIVHVLIKACAQALARVSELNSVLADEGILYFDQINMGVAVSLDDGLIVPVVRNVQSKTIFEVSRETSELAAKAREGKLLPDDMMGGTFTVSVLGTVDGFTPILNRGQSGILGAGRAVEKPVVRNGEIVTRDVMTVSLTADHQTVDGAVAAGFLRRFQQAIERPAQLFKSDDRSLG